MSDEKQRGACAECRFWQKMVGNTNYGKCLRFPPQFAGNVSMQNYWAFPETWGRDGCFEWQKK